MGREEDEAALRDAALFTAPGGDPGPAGRVFLAFEWLAAGITGIYLISGLVRTWLLELGYLLPCNV